MNTLQPTSRNKKTPRSKSGALVRTDQQPKGPMTRGVTGTERGYGSAISHAGDFGTIGAKLTTPTR